MVQSFKKLTPEEASEHLNKRPGRRPSVDLTEYKDNLQQLAANDVAEITYDSKEERRMHVGRYRRAAKELGLKIGWDYERGNNRAFLKMLGQADPAESVDGEEAPATSTPRRGRRPRQTVDEAEAVAA